jgi:V/A-type H+-transporting ATPase subunit I
MIVPMKRVTLLSFQPDQELTLNVLREMGVLHVTPVVVPDSDDLSKVQVKLAEGREALQLLSSIKGGVEAHTAGGTAAMAVDDVISAVRDETRRQKDLSVRIEGLEREEEAVRPFGSVEPSALQALADAGVTVKLCQMAATLPIPVVQGALVQVIDEGKRERTLAIVSREEVDCPGRECAWPARPLGSIQRELGETLGALEQSRTVLSGLAVHSGAVRERVVELETVEQFALVRDGMGAWDRINYLTGYCPAERVTELQAAAKQHGWGLMVRDPQADDQVPTLLRNSRWVQPIKAVFDMLGILPGYREIDVSVCFLLFFSLFFAMLVGDAGYGAIFLGLTVMARRKMPKAPVQPFALMIVMSIATMVWGVLTGTYFGIAEIPLVLKSLRIDWLTNEENLKLLCFVIGTVHLMVAHAWNGLVNRRSLTALAQLGWVGTTLCMFYLSRFMVLGVDMPSFVWPVMAGSVVLIVLFMTPVKALKDEWFNHVMLPLSVVSNFMDVISYVRLYAVGMASLALAMAFNEMAAGFGTGVGARMAAVVVLFLGHALNLVLAGMGVMVHGVRLNALEFSSHIGLSWTGVAFRPFAGKKELAKAE